MDRAHLDADAFQFGGIQNAIGTRSLGCFGHELLFAVKELVVLVVDPMLEDELDDVGGGYRPWIGDIVDTVGNFLFYAAPASFYKILQMT